MLQRVRPLSSSPGPIAYVFGLPSEVFHRETLLHEEYVVVMRKDHPAAENFELGQWLAFPHIVVSGRGDTRGALNDVLAKHGKTRRVGLVAPSFLMVPPPLEGSDLICMLPSRCVPGSSRRTFAVFPPPITVEGFPLHLSWHKRHDRNEGVQHVAGIVRTVLAAA